MCSNVALPRGCGGTQGREKWRSQAAAWPKSQSCVVLIMRFDSPLSLSEHLPNICNITESCLFSLYYPSFIEI